MSLTREQKKTNIETQKHIDTVKRAIGVVIVALQKRAATHDLSKLNSPEVEILTEMTPKLAGSTYGSNEYIGFLKEMKPMLDHHYSHNRHHPEYFKIFVCTHCNSEYIDEKPKRCEFCQLEEFREDFDFSRMNLIDLIEMFCDWKAATLRHDNGDLNKSITFNTGRFEINKQLVKIFENSVSLFEDVE